MTDKEYTELDRSQSEIYKYLDEIDEILSRKTKEERLEYFSKIGFPKSLNFNLDFGKSIIIFGMLQANLHNGNHSHP